ncbi:MAG: transcriptional regulator [Woeseiaceae bacterium]|nr:transcriptional regulator [Woeseiaceae bacterium]
MRNKAKQTVNLHFDEMISAPCRLGILATLVPGAPVSFTQMKAETSLSDGNLHVQTRKLADIGYIQIRKVKKGRRSLTEFRITQLGLEQLRLHVMKLQQVLDAAAGAVPSAEPVQRPDDSAVWA